MLSKEETIQYISQTTGFKSVERYRARCEFLFEGIPLKEVRVLDVGCGRGMFALWTAIQEASYVVGIEPESEGSTNGTLSVFRSIVSRLDIDDHVIPSSKSLEDVEAATDTQFDVAIMFNVINHLDEEAVIDLQQSDSAQSKYVVILRHLRSLMSDTGYVVVADCGRRNFWPEVGLRNPIAKTIEWHKHQQPETWISLFEQAGFKLHDLRWTPLYPFYKLTGNALAQYLLMSHFVLRFQVDT
jgi:2-polyprenyl-3-methyl-5-hydroxy-6-metoxy-1,4-benzoquinol methylase